MRVSHATALLLAALSAFLGSTPGCYTRHAPRREQDQEQGPSDELPHGATLMIGNGSWDVGNIHLPTVQVFSNILDSRNRSNLSSCGGVLIHPRIVITAGHCVCIARAPLPRDRVGRARPSAARDAGLKRAQALQDLPLAAITDSDSPCARSSVVTTNVYEAGHPEAPPTVRSQNHEGEVRVHPDFELILATRQGQPEFVWNNADLAAIILRRPVVLDFRPVTLPNSEIRTGEAISMAGYARNPTNLVGNARQFGDTRVTRLLYHETGSVVIAAEARQERGEPLAAYVEPGDSGGACVRKDNPNILVGITTMGSSTVNGTRISLFTSIHPHRQWLNQLIQQVQGP